MKHFLLIFLACVFFILESMALYGQKTKTNDTTICLRIVGLVVEKKEPIDGASVILYKENEQLEWNEITAVTHHDHRFSFDLLGNSHYSVEVSMPEYVPRLISISTLLPDSILIGKNKFVFEFQVEMFKKETGVDDYYFDFPVALISYNKEFGTFENNFTYTKNIKKEIIEAIKKAKKADRQQKK